MRTTLSFMCFVLTTALVLLVTEMNNATAKVRRGQGFGGYCPVGTCSNRGTATAADVANCAAWKCRAGNAWTWGTAQRHPSQR